jgi:hypothetical protein
VSEEALRFIFEEQKNDKRINDARYAQSNYFAFRAWDLGFIKLEEAKNAIR